ncbi:MAG: cohesin domain-containing protein [Anaerolineae bacterium]|nr:cohesin domain-containing protein [Anaerolineae bacterium]
MRTKSIIFIISGLIAIVTAALAQGNSPLVWLSADQTQLAAGETAVVTIYVDQAVDIYGGSFKLAYDPQTLEVVFDENKAVTAGTFFEDQPGFTLKNSADAQNGVVEYALTLTQPAEPVSGSGVIGTVTFHALSDTVVDVSPTETRLLSPEFSEVDGRKIARKINEIETRVQGTNINAAPQAVVEDSAPVTNELPQVVEQPQVEIAAPAAQQTISQPTVAMPSHRSNQLVLFVGGGLFLFGLALFAISLGTYSNLRRQYGSYQRTMEYLSW